MERSAFAKGMMMNYLAKGSAEKIQQMNRDKMLLDGLDDLVV